MTPSTLPRRASPIEPLLSIGLLLGSVLTSMAQTIQVESILRHPFSQDQRRFGAGVSLRRAGNGIDYLAISSVDMASAGGPADVRWYTLQNGIWEPVWHPLPDPIPYYRNFLSTPANLNSVGFGASVAMLPPYLVVGAPGSPNVDGDGVTQNRGTVFFFPMHYIMFINRPPAGNPASWAATDYRLTPRTPSGVRLPAMASSGGLGEVIATDGQRRVASSLQRHVIGPGRVGSVLVFGPLVTLEANNPIANASWMINAPLAAETTSPGVYNNDEFGASLAFSGNWLAVGAPGDAFNARGVNGSPADNTRIPESGAVYIYRLDSGMETTLIAKIKADLPDAGDRFGASIAMDAAGETLVVGAPNEDSNGGGINSTARGNDGGGTGTSLNRGAVYVFRRTGTTWVQTDFLKPFDFNFNGLPSNQRADQRFGRALAFDGTHLAITGGNNPATASVFVFERAPDGAWKTRQRLTPPTTNWVNSGPGTFGRTISIANGRIAVADPGEGPLNSNRGAVAIYAGLAPSAPPPPPPTSPIVDVSTGKAAVVSYGIPGVTYAFQSSSNLLDWATLHTIQAQPGDGKMPGSDASPMSSNQFYRFVQP